MPRKNYILYCDESSTKDRYFSNFYGGALINAAYREAIISHLEDKKEELNLGGELKWTKITEAYESKNIEFVDVFFDLIADNRIKLRIMFTQNYNKPVGLTREQIQNTYCNLYYQFIKHAFGVAHCNPLGLDTIGLSIYLDQFPDSSEKMKAFRNYLASLSETRGFKDAKVTVDWQDVTEVNSKEHVILQALDVVLGAINFRLNDRHLDIPAGKRRRAKRTRAKERVYKHINKRIRDLYPGFNIGVTTARKNERDAWKHAYRHWLFLPTNFEKDPVFVKNR